MRLLWSLVEEHIEDEKERPLEGAMERFKGLYGQRFSEQEYGAF